MDKDQSTHKNKTSPAQLRAVKRWRHRHKAHARLISYHNVTRHYIKFCTKNSQLDEVEDWIKNRRNELKENKWYSYL